MGRIAIGKAKRIVLGFQLFDSKGNDLTLIHIISLKNGCEGFKNSQTGEGNIRREQDKNRFSSRSLYTEMRRSIQGAELKLQHPLPRKLE